MPRTSRPITVTLGDLQNSVDTRVKKGAYASTSEVLRAALRALDREETAINDWLKRQIDEAFADPRQPIPAKEVFKELRARHRARVKARKNEKV